MLRFPEGKETKEVSPLTSLLSAWKHFLGLSTRPGAERGMPSTAWKSCLVEETDLKRRKLRRLEFAGQICSMGEKRAT